MTNPYCAFRPRPLFGSFCQLTGVTLALIGLHGSLLACSSEGSADETDSLDASDDDSTEGIGGSSPTSSSGGASSGGDSTSGGASGGTGGSAPADPRALGNAPVPSAGCGKNLGSLKSGTHKIMSAELERSFIVSLPDDYDPNRPYRLVYGMHWMGGSAGAVNNDGWFRLKPFDTDHSTIWVAPQGYTNQSPWRGGDDKDHTFFEELTDKLESELCVDTSRIFSVGFSFGAMFTNSLAQTQQSRLRGVVVYATADYNIYFPKNTGQPLAYMGVHGLTDDLCPISSGRNSKNRFVDNNGCTKPASVPEATSGGSHVSYDYECDERYPVKWATFSGSHVDQPVDPGQTKTWVPAESWDFITQF